MVSFSDHYNSIFIDRVPYKNINWRFHGILIISLQIILFSPDMQKVTFQLKNVKNNHYSTNDSLNHTKSCTKERHALEKYCTLHKNIKIS